MALQQQRDGRAHDEFETLAKFYAKDSAQELGKYKALRDLDVFVLDNSIRESTVAQLRGHTLDDKWKLYEEVQKCGFQNKIVANFSEMTLVDDEFVRQLISNGEDRRGMFAFTEVTEGSREGVLDKETVPVGLRRMKELGLWNPLLEVNLAEGAYNLLHCPIEDLLALLEKWIVWAHEHLHPETRVLVNLRDLPDAMPDSAHRVFRAVDFLARLPATLRPIGILFEEYKGLCMPEECGLWAKYIRQIMDANNWQGHLLVHVHEKFGFCYASQIQSLIGGADGIWGSVCFESAGLGSASACVTLMNLVRLGNKKITQAFNSTYLRRAAINVTKITTGFDPYSKTPVYGEQALDHVFDLKKEEFDLADFFCERAPVRISTMASEEMICTHLVELFGEDPQFTVKQANRMRMVMEEDLRHNRKEEYMSTVGVALLFKKAGGSLTKKMKEVIHKMELGKPHAVNLISQVRKMWDTWLVADEVNGNGDALELESFYSGFMAPYFPSFDRCLDTKWTLHALDLEENDRVRWADFQVYLTWAMHQYPDIKDAQELLDVTFRNGIVPSIRHSMVSVDPTAS
ncbi:uncharacterized protein LOC110977603 [Acanthaster planci]|uniref:Uncharacterized protein LOC110977603 n=1 Tax=Acanthaster planci TaxID=133434 RepID=A0A8B7Y701_ACAPL|nr:uncharacterized protein LOC110977603 [Acanthaster planci]